MQFHETYPSKIIFLHVKVFENVVNIFYHYGYATTQIGNFGLNVQFSCHVKPNWTWLFLYGVPSIQDENTNGSGFSMILERWFLLAYCCEKYLINIFLLKWTRKVCFRKCFSSNITYVSNIHLFDKVSSQAIPERVKKY